MASYTYEQLKDMTVADLREIAKGLTSDTLEGFSTMHKEQLLPVMCKAMGIPTHHAAQGAKKTLLKGMIHKLQTTRDAAIKEGKAAQAATARQQIHALKRQLRRMAEQAV